LEKQIINTSDKGWLAKLADAYKTKQPVILVDDAKVGIDPQSQTILQMGRQSGHTAAEWVSVGVSLGMSAAGIWMIAAGVADPEPTSKLGLLIGGGVICVAGGGFSAIRILTKHKPPNITLNKNGFDIAWE
jgi:hypothetical protein